MKLAENIRRLRLERGMTQSVLAEALGVSDRAVSRWENNAAMPDIALLARMALVLETSADALLGVDPLRMETEILHATEECTRLLNEGDAPAAVAMLREKSAVYPNQPELMVYLALALQRTGTQDAAREALRLCHAADGHKMRLSSTYGCKKVMILALKRLGRREEAARIAEDELPAIWVSRELMLAQVAPEERALRIRRSNVTLLSDLLFSTLKKLAEHSGSEAYALAARQVQESVNALPPL